MDTAKHLEAYEPEDPDEAARLDAEAEAAIAAGEVVPHERVGEWVRACVHALEAGEKPPPRPKTDAQLARERDLNR